MKLEDDLRRAFERRPAPAEFENRVFARIQRETPAMSAPSGLRRRALKWLAAAATIAAATGGARVYEHRQNVAEARRIESEIGLAMHVTREALARVQIKLRQTTN